jgi:Trypsin-co-occurring domain 2
VSWQALLNKLSFTNSWCKDYRCIIGQVRSELERATEGGKDSKRAFRAGPVELEFQVDFETTAAADAGV